MSKKKSKIYTGASGTSSGTIYTVSSAGTSTIVNANTTLSVNNNPWLAGSTTFVGYNNTVLNKTNYSVLGRDIEVTAYKDSVTAMIISMINVLGIEFYTEYKKQDAGSLPKEIEDFLERELVSHKRSKAINKILE